MIKTYKINGLKNCVVSGKKFFIKFEPKQFVEPSCFYTTSKENEIEFIESHPMFVKGSITLFEVVGNESVAVEEPKAEEEVKTVTKLTKVRSLTAAANVLINQFGADPDKVNDRDDIVAYAASVNIEFPNLK